jgi:pilus assembly protein Flp/PilA
MRSTIAKFAMNQDGATAIEYGLIAAAMCLGIIPVLGDVNTGMLRMFGIVSSLFDYVL